MLTFLFHFYFAYSLSLKTLPNHFDPKGQVMTQITIHKVASNEYKTKSNSIEMK